MFIIVPILLPIIAVVIILASPFWCVTVGSYDERVENRKKLGIFFGISFVLSAVISGMLYGFGSLKIWDKEVWNYKIVRMTHEERWSEEETRTREVYDGTDEDGHAQYHTETYHVTEYYGPYWTTIDEYGGGFRVDEATYKHWVKVWGNEKKTGEHHGSAAGWDTPITGGIFASDWPQNFETIYPYSDIHTYKNKVRYSHSVLKYKEPTKQLIKAYPRPADTGNISPVLGYGRNFSDAEVDLLRRTSAVLGPKCLIHPILLVFGPDTGRSVVDDILSAWRGPNKNELLVFMSLAGDEVKWCEVHSWMDNTTIHGMIRDEMMEGKFSVQKYSDYLRKTVPKYWHKKDFRDFDYLRVEIHWGWKVASMVMCLIVIAGTVMFVENGLSGYRGYRSYSGYRY